jgi:hypothetical protein
MIISLLFLRKSISGISAASKGQVGHCKRAVGCERWIVHRARPKIHNSRSDAGGTAAPIHKNHVAREIRAGCVLFGAAGDVINEHIQSTLSAGPNHGTETPLRRRNELWVRWLACEDFRRGVILKAGRPVDWGLAVNERPRGYCPGEDQKRGATHSFIAYRSQIDPEQPIHRDPPRAARGAIALSQTTVRVYVC